MDTTRFLEHLDEAFDDFDGDVTPAGPFLDIADDVDGLTTPHIMALLNIGAAHLGPDERYLEVGSYRGRSLLGAMAGHDHDRFTAIENFREFATDPGSGRAELLANVARWSEPERVQLLVGDAFELLFRTPPPLSGPIGMYFYDGVHGALAHYLALGIVEPHLADEALVVIDDASWPLVRRETARYVRRHPGFTTLHRFEARYERDPRWFNGLHVLSYRRPAGVRPRHGWDVRWRRLAHLHVYEPLWSWAWGFFPEHPRVTRLLKSVVPMRGKEVDET